MNAMLPPKRPAGGDGDGNGPLRRALENLWRLISSFATIQTQHSDQIERLEERVVALERELERRREKAQAFRARAQEAARNDPR
jgi:hypothetical protein